MISRVLIPSMSGGSRRISIFDSKNSLHISVIFDKMVNGADAYGSIYNNTCSGFLYDVLRLSGMCYGEIFGWVIT